MQERNAMVKRLKIIVEGCSRRNAANTCQRPKTPHVHRHVFEECQKRSRVSSKIQIPNGLLLMGSALLASMLLLNPGVAVSAFRATSTSCRIQSSLTEPQTSCSSSSTSRLKHSGDLKQRRIAVLYLADELSEEDPPDAHEEIEKRRRKRVVEGISNTTSIESELLSRITKLEALLSRHEVDLLRLRREVDVLGEAAIAFARLTQLLQKAGLADAFDQVEGEGKRIVPISAENLVKTENDKSKSSKELIPGKTFEYFDDNEIFGTAPASVIDAADAAGASILACVLGGKQRMLVDVRDAELSRDPEMLVQFVELAILPVAAGLEGLPKKTRNRVKIVFPTVSQLLQHRRSMSLVAPDVVALSTLGFDPVEKQDNLVVILAPAPDDEEGMDAMNELLAPTDPTAKQLRQPVVVINHHMVPLSGPAKDFEVAYHLRLLSVQYMSGDSAGDAPEYLKELAEQRAGNEFNLTTSSQILSKEEDDAELEAAMKHAHEIGMNHGITRAMVIRAYPKPWHVFVDTSPDTDADFEVAATFDEEPTQDDVNFAIVECLEGSETEDELVAFQMQQALEAGQLDKVSEMMGIGAGFEVDEMEVQSLEQGEGGNSGDSKLEDDENFYDDFDLYPEDSC